MKFTINRNGFAALVALFYCKDLPALRGSEIITQIIVIVLVYTVIFFMARDAFKEV